MPQGGSTIGFGRRGSLDFAGGSGQGAGGARLTIARNLCTNPQFGAGRSGYYLGTNTVALGWSYANGQRLMNETNVFTTRPVGATVHDSALLGNTCLLVGGLIYTRDFTWDMEQTQLSGTGSTVGPHGAAASTSLYQQGSPHSGTYCMGVQSTAGGNVGLSFGPTPIWVSRGYNISAWIKTAATARTASLTADYYDAAGNYLASDLTTNLLTDSTAWQQVTSTMAPPAGAVSANVTIVFAGTATNEIHYVDDVRIWDAGAAANAIPIVGGVTNTRQGPQDGTSDTYASYFFHALPNTTYTFSGYVRHAPEFLKNVTATNDLPNVNTFGNYGLRLYDANNATDFPTSSATIGTTLTGQESVAWQRHAVTYTTGSVVTAPIEIRFYGNRTWETDRALTMSAVASESSVTYPFTFQIMSASLIPALSKYQIGSYWDGIQIEEGVAASAYIDGTQRGCQWIDATDDSSRMLQANGNFDQANNIPWTPLTDWTANSSTGDGVLSVQGLGNNPPGLDWNQWFATQDIGFSVTAPSAPSGLSAGIFAWAGFNGLQYVAPANGARTRSGIVFDYHDTPNGSQQVIGGSAPTPTTVDNWRGTISFYARSISGDQAVVFALEDAAGTNLVLSQAFTLQADWRRYMVRFATAGNGFIDTSTTRMVFRQANPTNAATFQVAGVLIDQNPYVGNTPVDPVRDSNYLPGWPVNHEIWSTSIESPGDNRNSQFEYYWLISSTSARISGAAAGSDDVYVGLPSFSGVIDNSTINLSTINRSMLFDISGQQWRDIKFADDLYLGVDPTLSGTLGTAAITLFGTVFGTGSQQIGTHDIASTGNRELYLRAGGSYNTIAFWRDGAHAARDQNDSGFRFASFRDGITVLTSTIGGSPGGNPTLQLNDGATTPRVGSISVASNTSAFHPSAATGDVVIRGENSGNTQGIVLAPGPTSTGYLRVGTQAVFGVTNTNPSQNLITLCGTDPSAGLWLRNDGVNTVISTKQGSMYWGWNGGSGLQHIWCVNGSTAAAMSLDTSSGLTVQGNIVSGGAYTVLRSYQGPANIKSGFVTVSFSNQNAATGTITYGGTSFGASITVLTTVLVGSNLDILCNVTASAVGSFSYRLFQKSGTNVTGSVTLFWMAIG